ncbi:hypothetical protein AHF37_06351 [Paragonimus kellicotti]|nr:hypothetical protein AHF37_06351 [Paragonimus kellicotti]
MAQGSLMWVLVLGVCTILTLKDLTGMQGQQIEGDIFPPPAWRSAIAKLVQAVKFGLIVTVICGIDVFSALGIPTPSFITYGMQNKFDVGVSAGSLHNTDAQRLNRNARPTGFYEGNTKTQITELAAHTSFCILIEGDIFPPPAWRSAIAKLVQAVKFGLIVTVICGIDVFSALGIPTPSFITYGMQNKMSFCLMVFLLGNLVEGQLLSTGAFEVYFNGNSIYNNHMPIWSKLDSQRIPQPSELLEAITNQIKFDPSKQTFDRQSPSQSTNPPNF